MVLFCDYCKNNTINSNYMIMDDTLTIYGFCCQKGCRKWVKKNWISFKKEKRSEKT